MPSIADTMRTSGTSGGNHQFSFRVSPRRVLRAGDEFHVVGKRGRFRFMSYYRNGNIECVHGFGGTRGHEAYHAFDPAAVRAVPRRRRRI